MRVYLGRFERLLEDHTIFAGVTYTDAHVTLTGLLVVCAALVLGAVIAPSTRCGRHAGAGWSQRSFRPRSCYVAVRGIGWYVSSFIVKPNELVRERPYIAHNIEMTRQAYGLDRISQRRVSRRDRPSRRPTRRTIRRRCRTSGCGTGARCRTRCARFRKSAPTTTFPTSTSIATRSTARRAQMMLAARELNVDKLPESSRNWINEKLIYTHGYGVTMNPVNGFTPEGLPTLMLSNMPVQSTIPSLTVTRPEIYFGELTNTDVYVKTRQKEFNYPQGETNNLTSYEGNGGIVLGGFFRRLLIALDRGDLAKLPFSDDVTAESRLLMRRNIRERVAALAPFLTFDPDPYIVVGDDGRLSWMMDAFTTSDSYPYARHYRLGRRPHQLHAQQRQGGRSTPTTARRRSTCSTPRIRSSPPIARIFPTLFKDASAMPAGLRKHVRYPELLLKLQAAVYGLYHMTDPGGVLQPRGSLDGRHRSRR